MPGLPGSGEINADTDTLTLGTTVLTPAVPTVFARASLPAGRFGPVAVGIGGFTDVSTDHGISRDSPALMGYDGTSFGPVAVSLFNAAVLPTDAGDLTISSASDLVFSAVDEPSCLAMLLTGLAGFGLIGRSGAIGRGRRQIWPRPGSLIIATHQPPVNSGPVGGASLSV